jgi:hypothetical protein
MAGEQPPDINYARAYLRQMGGVALDDTSFDAGVSDTAVMDFWNQQHPAPAPSPAASSAPPETAALAQMAQIDPTSEALRNQLGQSYTQRLAQTPTPALNTGQAPSASTLQSYLDTYKQIDPTGFAQRQQLAGAENSYLQQAQAQAALGAQLDPSTQREVSQAARQAQVARGNVYGTPQLVQEAMQRGSAGEQRLQQRQAALGSALGQYQGYLGAGLGVGDLANQLYNTGFSQNLQSYNTQLGALNQAQGSALGYLGSGQTPYQVGAAYVNQAQNTAGSAAQGGPQYNPQALSQGLTGTAQQAPQYGLDIGAQAQQWYNSMSYYSGMQQGGTPQKNQALSAATGAATGALSGATAGSVIPGVGTAIGAIAGGILGGVGGYFG